MSFKLVGGVPAWAGAPLKQVAMGFVVRMLVLGVSLGGALGSGGCEGSDDWGLGGGLAETERAIYYGSREPQTVSLDEGSRNAIGWFYYRPNVVDMFCSGTLVSERAVLTARHCFDGQTGPEEVGFGVGESMVAGEDAFLVEAVFEHPELDVALVLLSRDAVGNGYPLRSMAISSVSPEDLVGQLVEGAGYGLTHDGSTGRYFAAVRLSEVWEDEVVVDGQGRQGFCSGDSGGPLIGPTGDLIAVESRGDDSCVDVDYLTRGDRVRSWVETIVAEGSSYDPCDGLDYLGRCDGDVAVWCQNGRVFSRDCGAEGAGCGYVDDELGYYCGSGSGGQGGGVCPEGYGTQPQCDGDELVWCEGGSIRSRDCRAEDSRCVLAGDGMSGLCVPSESLEAVCPNGGGGCSAASSVPGPVGAFPASVLVIVLAALGFRWRRRTLR